MGNRLETASQPASRLLHSRGRTRITALTRLCGRAPHPPQAVTSAQRPLPRSSLILPLFMSTYSIAYLHSTLTASSLSDHFPPQFLGLWRSNTSHLTKRHVYRLQVVQMHRKPSAGKPSLGS